MTHLITKQRFIIDENYFQDLSNHTNSNKLGIEQWNNKHLFIESLFDEHLLLGFNSSTVSTNTFKPLFENDNRFDKDIHQWLYQSCVDHNRITTNEKFISDVVGEPVSEQLNSIYLKSFTDSEYEETKKKGVLALTPSDIISNTFLYKNLGSTMEKGERAKWSFPNFNNICNAVIIADLYILTRDKRDNLYPLLDAILPRDNINNFSIYIYTKTEDGLYDREESAYLVKEWKEIKDWLKKERRGLANIELVITSCSSFDFHDRHILTNYIIINCGSGFDNISSTDRSLRNNSNDLRQFRSSSFHFEIPETAHSTSYHLFYTLFNIHRNKNYVKEYINTLKEIRQIDKSSRIKRIRNRQIVCERRNRVDNNYINNIRGRERTECRLLSLIP